jgi:hypothetical protein
MMVYCTQKNDCLFKKFEEIEEGNIEQNEQDASWSFI